ncbi:MAG: hypothetical protein ABFR97_09035 [Thermodesulfobacteriota bacterium]
MKRDIYLHLGMVLLAVLAVAGTYHVALLDMSTAVALPQGTSHMAELEVAVSSGGGNSPPLPASTPGLPSVKLAKEQAGGPLVKVTPASYNPVESESLAAKKSGFGAGAESTGGAASMLLFGTGLVSLAGSRLRWKKK